MSSFPLTKSIIFQDGHIAPASRCETCVFFGICIKAPHNDSVNHQDQRGLQILKNLLNLLRSVISVFLQTHFFIEHISVTYPSIRHMEHRYMAIPSNFHWNPLDIHRKPIKSPVNTINIPLKSHQSISLLISIHKNQWKSIQTSHNNPIKIHKRSLDVHQSPINNAINPISIP